MITDGIIIYYRSALSVLARVSPTRTNSSQPVLHQMLYFDLCKTRTDTGSLTERIMKQTKKDAINKQTNKERKKDQRKERKTNGKKERPTERRKEKAGPKKYKRKARCFVLFNSSCDLSDHAAVYCVTFPTYFCFVGVVIVCVFRFACIILCCNIYFEHFTRQNH